MNKRQSFRTDILEPHACPPKHVAKFRQLVLEGGEVDAHTLPALIERALALALVRDEESVVGIGAIKRPNASYRNRVFGDAKSRLVPAQFDFELGWIYLCEAARGKRLTTPIVQALLLRLEGRPVYATSRVDNVPMHASLTHCGFRKEGTPFPSKQNQGQIQLFVLV